MKNVEVSAEFDVPGERLWKLVADFGNVEWIPGMGAVRVVGEGPGMTRFLPAGEVEIHERLENVDDERRTLVYTIPVNIPFPVTDYRATMRVDDTVSGSRLTWSCTYEPVGVGASEAQQTVKGLYEMMIGWMREHLAADEK